MQALRSFCVLFFMALTMTSANAQPITERLYKGAAPGSQHWSRAELVQKSVRGDTIFNVRDPEITAYLPDPAHATGAAVIVLPGGALRMLVIGQENQDIIARFNASSPSSC